VLVIGESWIERAVGCSFRLFDTLAILISTTEGGDMRFASALFTLVAISISQPTLAQVIDACVKKDGAIRIVGSSADCRSNESAISWNVTGPEGPQGPVGEQGPVGDQGAAGNNLWVVDGNGATVGQLVDLNIHVPGSSYLTVYGVGA
jgi:hypothetical protein